MIVLVTVGATWLPPVGVAAETLSSASPTQAASTIPLLGGMIALAALLMALAGVASWSATRRG